LMQVSSKRMVRIQVWRESSLKFDSIATRAAHRSRWRMSEMVRDHRAAVDRAPKGHRISLIGMLLMKSSASSFEQHYPS
jgi:hypothetical protein